ncbi:Calcium ding protein-like protein family member (Cbn-1) [Dirofilaria immitis]|nr:Calcium ding protein-like protein family member (Cbn-1) [Dirofilaria immitis]
MTHYDLTKDGKVDNRELRTVAYMDHKLPPAISDNIFRKADRSGDKFIDRTEIIAAVRLIRRNVAQATSRWLEDHDMDGDGRMNEMELLESIYMEHGLPTTDVNGCFRESDVDKDKYLTSSELVEALHCSRLLALKEAKELLKIYDTDGDYRLNIQEAQMLASLRYGIEPSYATTVFEDVSHRADHTINELELIDFLTKLREKAAIAALNKLSGLDRNGDEANAHIDPVEFVSLQNLIADKIHLRTIQNDSEEQYSTTTNAATSLPTLIIFRSPKNHIISNHPDLEIDKKLVINVDLQPGIRELTATNASSIYFSTVVTAVPKFMKSNNNYQKFISDGAKLISEMLDDNKRREDRKDRIETWENSVSDDNGSPLIQETMQSDHKLSREGFEHSSEESNLHDEEEKDQENSGIVDENDCTSENQTNSFNSDEHQNQTKEYKCNIRAQRSNETIIIGSLQKNKSLSRTESLEHETTPSLSRDVENENSLLKMENKSSSVSHKMYFEYSNDESIEMIPEAEEDEESSELFDEKRPGLYGFEKIIAKANENRLSSHEAMQLEEGKSVNKSELPVHILLNKQSKDDKFLKANSMFSTENNTNEYGQQIYSQRIGSQLLKLYNSSSKQTQMQIMNTKNQEMPNSSGEDELFDKILSDILNATLYEINQTSTAENSENQSNITVSQKNKKTSVNLPSPSSSKISSLTTIDPKLSAVMNQSNKTIDEQSTTEVRSIEKKRNECSPENKCPTRDDISVEVTVPILNTTDIICNKKDLSYECRLKKQYRSKESLHQSLKTNETNQSQVNEWRTGRSEDLLLRAIQEYREFLPLNNSSLLMSSKQHEITALRPSLKKQSVQTQAQARDSGIKRAKPSRNLATLTCHFVTPKLPPSKCNLPKQQSTSDQLDSKLSQFPKQKSFVDVHRKRIPSVQLAELRTKKNKHNEQIVRLCEAQKALVKSDYIIKRLEKKAREQETAAAALLQNAVSLIETDVLRSFEKQRIGDLLDSAEQQQHRIAQELYEEIAGYNERIAGIEKAMATIEKYNTMLDTHFTFEKSNRSSSVAEEMKLLSTDISFYLGVLNSLKKFHL